MNVEPNCPQCGGELQATWKACPFCGAAIVTDEPADAALPSILGLESPYANHEKLPPEYSKIWYAETQREGRKDLAGSGIGLIILGVIGFVGGCTLIFSGMLNDMGSLEALTICILLGGGLLIAMVVAGTVMVTSSGKTHSGQNTATGIMVGLLAGVMVIGLIVLTILASIIYAIHDCLNACQSL